MSVRVKVTDQGGKRAARLVVAAARIRTIARAALEAEGISQGELSVLVTRDAGIRELNARYRGKDAATNVLSFPQGDPRKGGLLGDIAISIDYVDKQGKETGSGFAYTFAYYLVHGVLHLVGHDHHEKNAARRMYRRTEKILEDLGE